MVGPDSQSASRHDTANLIQTPKDFCGAAPEPVQRELDTIFPTADEYHDGPVEERTRQFRGDEFAGIREFPLPSVELSLLAVHPRLVEFAATVLGADDIRLSMGEAWAKYAGAADYRQAHHRDYFNPTPLVPSAGFAVPQLEMFVYHWPCRLALLRARVGRAPEKVSRLFRQADGSRETSECRNVRSSHTDGGSMFPTRRKQRLPLTSRCARPLLEVRHGDEISRRG